VDDLRGVSRLAVDATRSVTDVVEEMHGAIGGIAAIFAAPVYASIRAITSVVGFTLDAALSRLAPLLGESASTPDRETVLAVLNGVIGDYLAETKNPLAIEMRLHAAARSGRRLLVMVHGSSMTHLQCTLHPEALARDLGYAVAYLQYNSGLHVSTNAAAFAQKLDELVQGWPEPLDEIVLVGHSMGGLVARSAVHAAEQAKHAWRGKLTKLISIGAPHHGAPLERAGNWFETLLGITRYSAPLARLGQLRSAGVTDLRWGNVLDEHWQGRDRFELAADPRTPLPLPADVTSFAIAGTTATTGDAALPGDGIVPVDSALGRHANPDRALAFSEVFIAHGTKHLELLAKAEVYDVLRRWL
jgi:pimeloyl-ACP methyl ester carboxylesterase